MKKRKPSYKPFDNFVLRTPLYPVNRASGYHTHKNDPDFKEALFLASPDIYRLADGSSERRADEKVEQAILKYYIRACTRCTPFGLFAGCSVGSLGDETSLSIPQPEEPGRVTRLDMQYLCALVQEMVKDADIRGQLRFYPNDSLYGIGGKLRYIEYHYKNSRRIHRVSSVEESDYLLLLLEKSRAGLTIDELAREIVDEEVTLDEAREFVNELIDEQLLKSEIEPSVVGEDFMETLLVKLSRLEPSGYTQKLSEISSVLKGIDSTAIGLSIAEYHRIIEIIKGLEVGYEEKYLFQSDLYHRLTKPATISRSITEKIQGALDFTARLNMPHSHQSLDKFKEAFYNRFEEAEVPLTVALDNELGIGYPPNSGTGDINVLVDDIAVPAQLSRMNRGISLSPIDVIILKKYIEAIKEGKTEIELLDDDFKGEIEGELPATVAVMCSIFTEGGRLLVHIKSAGGSCAGNLIGRFCHLDPAVKDIAERISLEEKESNPNVIFAELAHLPESRIGNIASRPLFRDYVIHYLSNTDCTPEKSIPVSDLMVSIRQNRICLRSKMLDKMVVPRLTCAHNYSMSPIPIYKFLADLQTLTPSRSFGLYLGEVFNAFDYTPRIKYGDIILSEQKWQFKKEEIKDCYKLNDDELTDFWDQLARRRKITRYVVLPEGDNEMYVDLREPGMLRNLLALVSKKEAFTLKEFFFDGENSIVGDRNSSYSNEFIFFFSKNK